MNYGSKKQLCLMVVQHVRHIQKPVVQAPPSRSAMSFSRSILRNFTSASSPRYLSRHGKDPTMEGPGEGCFGANTKRWKSMEKLWDVWDIFLSFEFRDVNINSCQTKSILLTLVKLHPVPLKAEAWQWRQVHHHPSRDRRRWEQV